MAERTQLVTVIVVLAMMAMGQARGVSEEARLLGKSESWDYGPAMQKVAARFQGADGVVLHLGDSITYASPYTAWARNGKGHTPEDKAILKWSHCGERNDWDGWYLASHDVAAGRSFTAAGGVRSDQYIAGGHHGLPPLDEIIGKYNPQVAVLMLGTNDVWQGRSAKAYAADMDTIIQRLLNHGTVVIISTIPPMITNLELGKECNEEIWRLAERHKLPVIDYYGEIMARRPGMTWNGTLLEKDDPHPTAARAGVTHESEPRAENLRESGYLLRGWLSVKKLIEVKERVLKEGTVVILEEGE